MYLVRPFVLGAAAAALVLYVAAAAVGITADARGWPSFALEIGPLALLAFERTGTVTSFELGSGLAAVSAVAGLANAAAAGFLLRRRQR